MRLQILFLLFVLGLRTACAAPPVPQEVIRFGTVEFQPHVAIARGFPPITFYQSGNDPSMPTLLLVQGSGCQPLMVRSQGNQYSTFYGLINAAQDGRFNVLVVEKPHAAPSPIKDAGTAKNCPPSFNQTFTLESWVTALQLALDTQIPPERRKLPVYVFGVSEGAVVASRLAALRPKQISRVALIGLSGSSQLFDFVQSTYQTTESDGDVVAELAALETTIRDVNKNPTSADKFFAGHPYKRWSSFFKADATADLLKSSAAVYLVSGMQDHSVPIRSTERAWTSLLVAGRDVTFRRVPGADHGLMSEKHPDMKAVAGEYAAIFDWLATGSNAPSAAAPEERLDERP